MLQNTFQLLPGISKGKEKQIWKQAKDWNAFLTLPTIFGISQKRKLLYNNLLIKAKQALVEENSAYFTSLLPKTLHYRLWSFFSENALYLDIEGANNGKKIRMIGVYDGYESKVIIPKFISTEQWVNFLRNYSLIITFNGNTFDIPALEKFFGFTNHLPVIDLKPLCRKLGLNGGLKEVEKQLTIKRQQKPVLQELSDDDYSYHCDFKAERNYLRLKHYNEEDVINLKPIAEKVIHEVWNTEFHTAVVNKLLVQ